MGARYRSKNYPKISASGFAYKQIIDECSWMHPKNQKKCCFGILREKPRATCLYRNQNAWLETPLHFCCWLHSRRIQKQNKALLSNKRKKEKANTWKRLKYAQNQKFREESNLRRKLHRYRNLDKHREWSRTYAKKRRMDYGIRLKTNARSRFWKVMKSVKKQQITESFNSFIGCSTSFLQEHIQGQFTKIMSWSNYATTWEVDHKIPLKYFDLKNKEQAKRAFHFSNLQPATLSYNRSKQARWSDV